VNTRFVREGGFVEVARWLAPHRGLLLCGESRRFVDLAVAALGDVAIFDRARVHVPAETVEEAEVALAAANATALLAIGGGSPIGLGKALRHAHPELAFAVVPTTYAGSEMTTLFGITRGRDKQTGKDPHVRPDLVVYDASLARDMPIALTVQSLLNAFAHVASIGRIEEGRGILDAIDELLVDPRDLAAREHAARAASACASLLETGTPSEQHGLAHLLGGALRLDHAALHAILLPHFVRWKYRDETSASRITSALTRAGAPTTLVQIGATEAGVRDALATKPALPAELALAAL